jgi:hypothetical protein
MKMQIQTFTFGLKLAVVVFPAFFLLDYFLYPDHKYSLLLVRIGISIYSAFALLGIRWVREKYYFAVILFSMFLISFAVSLMCFITGDGFASPYYAGVLQIMVITMLFFGIKPKHYMLIMATIILQHFILLSFIPWEFKDLLINMLALGVFSPIAILVHNYVYNLVKENQKLKGFLPICSSCKKIRDDQGYWNQIESYITANSEAQFSHSFCPDCAKKLYPEYVKHGN